MRALSQSFSQEHHNLAQNTEPPEGVLLQWMTLSGGPVASMFIFSQALHTKSNDERFTLHSGEHSTVRVVMNNARH